MSLAQDKKKKIERLPAYDLELGEITEENIERKIKAHYEDLYGPKSSSEADNQYTSDK